MNKANAKLVVVNNTGADLGAVHPLIIEFAETGEIHEDIADIFHLKSIEVNGERRVVVEFLD